MITRLFALVLLSLTIVGCATSYQSSRFSGGYSETWLAPDIVRVNFNGNGYTSRERAQDFALLRAAELTLQRGYSRFAIINGADTVSQSSFTTPGQSYTTGSVNAYGRNAYYSAQTTYVPGDTVVINKPHSGLLIKCFTSEPKGAYTFDAQFLQASLRQKYKVKSS